MTGFDAAWLAEHKAKMAAYQAKRLKPIQLTGGDPPSVDLIEFTLARPFSLLNVMLRMHWSRRRRYHQSISSEIAATGLIPVGMAPMAMAEITIVRYSIKEPDRDGLYGGAKWVVDALLVRSARHPAGLGVLIDDSPAHLTWDVKSEVVRKRSEQRTEIRIERLA